MSLIDSVYKKAKLGNKTIILPESTEERNLRATEIILREKLASVILVGNKKEIELKSKEFGVNISGATIREPLENNGDDYISQLVEIRKSKGLTFDEAKNLLQNPLYFAAMLVKRGEADGYVAGSVNTTGDVLRPALQIIRTAEGCKTVSSCFIMVLPDGSPYSKTARELFFADCAVVPDPDENQLADIAVSTAKTYKSLVSGDDPRVAMLCFSTKGSAKNYLTEKVVRATELVKKKAPELSVDGELQADSALISKVGELKCPGSSVAGRANILVFPDLNSGNISYKLVQRLAGAAAVGPVVQGLAKPVNDLSRGCSVKDIVDTVAVTSCQACS